MRLQAHRQASALRRLAQQALNRRRATAGWTACIAGSRRERDAAWTYERPAHGFESLVGLIALYPGRMDRCTVDGEVVRPQEGGFYGGWITADVVGPFKGDPGTSGW